MKLFIFNFYEIFLICLGIAFALGKDDLTSLIYQVILQILLAISKIKLGKFIGIQMKITIVSCVTLLLTIIAKVTIVLIYDDSFSSLYSSYSTTLNLFGFESISDSDGNVTGFDYVRSVLFEVLFLILNLFLTQYYYMRIPKKNLVTPVVYVDNSAWLRSYMTSYYLFFVLIFIDTIFARNLIYRGNLKLSVNHFFYFDRFLTEQCFRFDLWLCA